MKEYFKLQFKMTNRRLTEFGVPPIVAYLTLLVLFFYLSTELFKRTEYAGLIYTFVGISSLIHLAEENKINFLKLIYSKIDFLKIRLLENLSITFLFWVILIYNKAYLLSFFIILISCISVFYTFNKKNNFTIKTPFYKYPFEFCTGFRKTFFIFILCYFLTYIAVDVTNYNLAIFSLLLIQFTCLTFYISPENIFYVWIYSLNPKGFIRYKFRIAILYSTVLCLPTILCLLFFFQNEILISLGILVLSYLFIFTGMLAKYTAFPNEISIREGVVLVFLIWFPPILVLIIPYLYFQSIKNLKTILK
ncbi:ABC transporter permease [Flavobacterium jejuense]|uniref:ABC transporter permease n=1 Tax=Flavobacterium jejuense TaxID=1544455 RepID=A0ABX0IQW7_9FLAO|nr:ABC transporter permease [Flavobacterium jejuense]NHN25971.1 ABC transporter permease [Flavobacterium jejuense]